MVKAQVDCAELPKDLLVLSEGATEWQMRFNISKLDAYWDKNPLFTFLLMGSNLEVAD